jgi:hypothetical protein
MYCLAPHQPAQSALLKRLLTTLEGFAASSEAADAVFSKPIVTAGGK